MIKSKDFKRKKIHDFSSFSKQKYFIDEFERGRNEWTNETINRVSIIQVLMVLNQTTKGIIWALKTLKFLSNKMQWNNDSIYISKCVSGKEEKKKPWKRIYLLSNEYANISKWSKGFWNVYFTNLFSLENIKVAKIVSHFENRHIFLAWMMMLLLLLLLLLRMLISNAKKRQKITPKSITSTKTWAPFWNEKRKEKKIKRKKNCDFFNYVILQ